MTITRSLNERQRRFVLLVLEGNSPPKAFRLAGYKTATKHTAEANAFRLMKHDGVRSALAAARSATVARAAITVDHIVAELDETRDRALSADPPQLQAAVNASVHKAKMLGIYVERSELNVTRDKPSLVPTKTLELSEEEWRRQFALPQPTKGTDHNDR